MNHESVAAFESIESAQEYLGLLAQVVLESQEAIEADIQANVDSGSPRRVEALRLIGYNLDKLAHHIKASRRILNDLRMLRRLLFRGIEEMKGQMSGAAETQVREREKTQLGKSQPWNETKKELAV